MVYGVRYRARVGDCVYEEAKKEMDRGRNSFVCVGQQKTTVVQLTGRSEE